MREGVELGQAVGLDIRLCQAGVSSPEIAELFDLISSILGGTLETPLPNIKSYPSFVSSKRTALTLGPKGTM